MKRKICGYCPGCTKSDCGRFRYCTDKPKFGGLGKKKECCEHKKCQSPTTPERIFTSTDIQSEVHNEASASIATIDKFLLNHNRKIHNIKGDGNCLFRSFSHAFLNHEDHHFTLRNHIVRTINLNPTIFSNYLMPINKLTIEQQVKHMLRPSVWGTHLELKAAATLFQFLSQQQQPHDDPPFSWSTFQPLSLNLVKLPHIIDEEAQLKEDKSHQLYHHNSHYDIVISLQSEKTAVDMPTLTGNDDNSVINISDDY